MINYEKISFCFFGCLLNEFQEKAIITNIRPIYSTIVKTGKVVYQSENFYSYATVQMKNGCKISLFGISQGNCIIDVVKLISQKSKKIIFWGIGGAISEHLSIGDVVEVANYCSVDKNGCILHQVCNYIGKMIAQTDGLIQNRLFYNTLKQQNIDIVDMESVDFFNICEQLHINCRYFIFISDLPLILPFYEVEPCSIAVENFLEQIEEWLYDDLNN